MRYSTGEKVEIGDRVQLGADADGIVVADIGRGELAPGFLSSEWAYLRAEVLIEFPTFGVIHYESQIESDVSLVERALRKRS